ncbi:uncharacterized protein LOC143265944 [Megachile rotundata]|uniref:uncharacterized protein LOC143265944 n=1 Tax=Megachile rotundata TaxID=143995 RepID=UPI003FD69940
MLFRAVYAVPEVYQWYFYCAALLRTNMGEQTTGTTTNRTKIDASFKRTLKGGSVVPALCTERSIIVLLSIPFQESCGTHLLRLPTSICACAYAFSTTVKHIAPNSPHHRQKYH